MLYTLSVFFFFQAEDGIRDDLVTGVQTCALPISRKKARWDCGGSALCCEPASIVHLHRIIARRRPVYPRLSRASLKLHTLLQDSGKTGSLWALALLPFRRVRKPDPTFVVRARWTTRETT